MTSSRTAPVTGKPLRRDAAENRARLLTAAALVFADHGLAARVDEVARVAGVGMGTLYRRFPSKQALIDTLVGGIRRDLLEMARTAAARTDGSGLEELLFAAGELQAAQPGCLQRLWEHSEAGRDAIEEFRTRVVALLHSAQAHGRVRSEIASTDITMVFWSVRGVIESTRTVAPTAWRRHLELLIAGLRPTATHQFATELSEQPLTAAQVRRITGPKA
jgi:AcrR family transcriptional regulator